MRFIRSLFGRRQFLITFISSTLVLVFNRIVKAFNLFLQSGIAQAANKPNTANKKPLKGIVVYYSAVK